MVCCSQRAWGGSGGCRISGRSRSSLIDAGAERAADLAHGGRALDPVAAVGVLSGEAAGLAAGGLGGLRVVCCGLFPGRAWGEGPRFQQRPRCLRAVEIAVADDGAVVSAPGAAVVRVQVLD